MRIKAKEIAQELGLDFRSGRQNIGSRSDRSGETKRSA